MHYFINIFHYFTILYIINKETKFEPNIQSGLRVMSIFTKRARPAKMMLGEASSHFFIPVAGQYVKIHKYTKFEQNIFTDRAQSARVMLDEASSPFCIPVAGQR